MKITQEYMNKYFSEPHEKGKVIRFYRNTIKKFMESPRAHTPHKRGTVVNFSTVAPLNNLFSKLTIHRKNSPRRPMSAPVRRVNTTNTRRKLLKHVNYNSRVNFYSKYPEYIVVNFPNKRIQARLRNNIKDLQNKRLASSRR